MFKFTYFICILIFRDIVGGGNRTPSPKPTKSIISVRSCHRITIYRCTVQRRCVVSGPANRQHLSGHRYRQRDVGPVLRARRVHGRRGGRIEGVVRRQRPVVARRGQTEEVRGAHDQVGQPVPAGLVAGHQTSTVRGTRAHAGGYRHILGPGNRGHGQPDVPEEGVARQMGKSPCRHQLPVLEELEILSARYA